MSFFEQISLKNNFNASFNTNMWQVYTRPTSASDFLIQIFANGANGGNGGNGGNGA
jgi:hypothetical protein